MERKRHMEQNQKQIAEQTITCIGCPVGCRLKVQLEDGQVTAVSGNACKRGIPYAKQECVSPKRMVTAVVAVQNRKEPLSVKTQAPIPKQDIFRCMREISTVKLNAPVTMGQVICRDVCGSGVDVVATKPLA